MENKIMRAFYFSEKSRKLRHGDGRDIVVGESHIVEVEPKVCEKGLHASTNIMDALSYAPGNILYLVELSGDMDIGKDKVAATTRKYIAEFDATELLIQFAKKQALINIEKIKPYCDARSYKTVIDYLKSDKCNHDAAYSAYADCAAYAYSYADAAFACAACAYAIGTVGGVDAGVGAARAAATTASAADAGVGAARARQEQEKMLLKMIKESTGWDICN